jgi:hypothetical protein
MSLVISPPAGPSLLTFPNTQTDTDYTLVLADENTGVIMSSSAAHNLTVPANSSVAFDIGAQIVVEQGGSGQVTIVAGGGVTVNGSLYTAGQYSVTVLIKQATDTWLAATGNPALCASSFQPTVSQTIPINSSVVVAGGTFTLPSGVTLTLASGAVLKILAANG